MLALQHLGYEISKRVGQAISYLFIIDTYKLASKTKKNVKYSLHNDVQVAKSISKTQGRC